MQLPQGIPGTILPDAHLLGELAPGRFPPVDGYNLSYLKPGATMGVISDDEYQAPLSAFWYRGLGRVVALTVEVDGPFSGAFARWNEYEDFLLTHARWLLSGGELDDVYVQVRREGQDAVVTLELAPESWASVSVPPKLVVIPPSEERADPYEPDLIWTGPQTLQARFRLDRPGIYRTLVRSGSRRFLRGPSLTLPYSPEYMPRTDRPAGDEVLAALAELTGGQQRTDVTTVFADPPRSPRTVSLLPALFVAALLLLIAEIAGRRLSLWERLSRSTSAPAPGVDEIEAVGSTDRAAEPSNRWSKWARVWQSVASRWRGSRATAPPRSPSAEDETIEGQRRSQPTSPASPAPSEKPPAVSDVFAQAKSRAKRRLK
ncbi:MAG TPA: hypothetical protein EYP14_03240 [Planctomycetaceae bacterium]|nr:hypothetical protein [Planctomycetaceae bacterium]